MRNTWQLVLLATWLVSATQARLIRGTVRDCESNRGVPHVIVTNGNDAVRTRADGTFCELHPEDGKPAGHLKLGVPFLSSPARVGNRLCIADYAGRVFTFRNKERDMASLPDLKTFRDMTKITTGPILQDTFDRGNSGWDLKPGFRLAPRMGLNGTTALAYTRTDPEDYPVLSRNIDMKEHTTYVVRFHFRTEGIVPPKGRKDIRYVASIEYRKGQKWLSGIMSDSKGTLPINQTWQEVRLETIPPQGRGMDNCVFQLFLEHGYQGTIYYDNLTVEPLARVNAEIYATRPGNLALDPKGRLECRAALMGTDTPPARHLAMLVTAGGRTRLLKPSRTGAFAGDFGPFPQGEIPVTARLLNLKEREILASRNFNLFSPGSQETVPGASRLDDRGFVRIDGRKILPIGFFGNNLTQADMKRLKDSHVNFYMPYTSMFMGPDGSYVNSFAKVKETMDAFQNHGIKVLFALNGQNPSQGSFCRKTYDGVDGVMEISQAFIRRLRNHPAMLGYYLSDENPLNELPYIRSVREMAARLDPHHFSVTLTFIPNDFPAYVHTGDVLAVDSYPVNDKPDPSMSSIYKVMDAARKLDVPLWFVPQTFSWGCFKNLKPGQSEEFRRWPFPTETQLRAMTLAGAVAGAKGFLFYCYDAIFEKGERFLPGSAERNWRRVNAVLKLLHELEPFLLSEQPAPKVRFTRDRSQGTVRAQAWTNGQNVAVIVTANGPGKTQATLHIPGCENLKSTYGLTKHLGNGTYQFSCEGMNADVLVTP